MNADITHEHTSSEVLLTDNIDEDGSLFLPSVANEDTFAVGDKPWLLLVGLFDNVCLCCKNYTNTAKILINCKV